MEKSPRIYLFGKPDNNKALLDVREHLIHSVVPMHWHNYIELELVTDGSGMQHLNGQALPLTRGSLSVIRLTDYHQIEPDDYMRLTHVKIAETLLPAEQLARISTEPMMFYQLEEEEFAPMEQLLYLCREESELPTPDPVYLRSLMTCIFIRILRLMPEGHNPLPGKNNPLQEARLYLHMHFREDPSLQEVAALFHYHPSYFSSVFRKEMRISYSDYLNTLKISYAKQLLLSTELKFIDICYECGFSSYSNFLQCFKAQVGCSPSRFRKMSRS